MGRVRPYGEFLGEELNLTDIVYNLDWVSLYLIGAFVVSIPFIILKDDIHKSASVQKYRWLLRRVNRKIIRYLREEEGVVLRPNQINQETLGAVRRAMRKVCTPEEWAVVRKLTDELEGKLGRLGTDFDYKNLDYPCGRSEDVSPRFFRRRDPPKIFRDGQVKSRNRHGEETFCYSNGKLHRTDGPAVLRYDRGTQKIYAKEWWVNGKRHREDAPLHHVGPRRSHLHPDRQGGGRLLPGADIRGSRLHKLEAVQGVRRPVPGHQGRDPRSRGRLRVLRRQGLTTSPRCRRSPSSSPG